MEFLLRYIFFFFICANMVSKYYSGLLLLKACKHSQQNKLLQNDIMTIDKQKGFRRDCVRSVEDGELEVGVSGVSCLCMITEKILMVGDLNGTSKHIF